MAKDCTGEGTPANLEPTEEQLRARVEFLRKAKPEHFDLLKKILAADDANLFHVDLVVMAAMNRSISLIDGFATLVERRNALAAIPLVRLQIDSVIRLYACWLVDDPPVVAQTMLQNLPLNRVKSRDGKPLTDAELYRAAAEFYPWIPNVYRESSGFVHLSGRHITAPMQSMDADTGHFTGFVGATPWRARDVSDAVEAFIEATTALLHLCWSWLQTKEMGRLSPEERASRAGVALPEYARRTTKSDTATPPTATRSAKRKHRR